MPNLGMGELVVILLIVMVVFGASRLPQLGEGVGKAIKNFKRGLNSDDDIDVSREDQKRIEGRSAERLPSASVEKADVSEAEVIDRRRNG